MSEVNSVNGVNKYSVEWHDHVMEKFSPDELVDGSPTVDGLRRVFGLMGFSLVNSNVSVINCTEKYACVKYSLVYRDLSDESGVKRCEDVADCSPHNADGDFARFPSALACTRAEGRVLRKVLGLRKVVTVEEKYECELENKGEISAAQLNYIENECKNLGIDAFKLAKTVTKNKVSDLSKLTHAMGISVISHLQEIKNGDKAIAKGIKK